MDITGVYSWQFVVGRYAMKKREAYNNCKYIMFSVCNSFADTAQVGRPVVAVHWPMGVTITTTKIAIVTNRSANMQNIHLHCESA